MSVQFPLWVFRDHSNAKKACFFSGIVYSGVIVLHVTRSFYDYFSTTTQMTKFNCGSQTRGINGRKLILVFILLNKQHNAAFPICYDYASEKIIQTIYLPPTRWKYNIALFIVRLMSKSGELPVLYTQIRLKHTQNEWYLLPLSRKQNQL